MHNLRCIYFTFYKCIFSLILFLNIDEISSGRLSLSDGGRSGSYRILSKIIIASIYIQAGDDKHGCAIQ
jgi:hypothetical protein